MADEAPKVGNQTPPDDDIKITLRIPTSRAPARRLRLMVDDEVIHEFPEGTTLEEAESIYEEAKRVYLAEISTSKA